MYCSQIFEALFKYQFEFLICLFIFFPSGCSGEWDFACWPSASVGQLVTIPCPKYFTHVSDWEGNTNTVMDKMPACLSHADGESCRGFVSQYFPVIFILLKIIIIQNESYMMFCKM